MIKFTQTLFKILYVIIMLVFITSCTQEINFEKTKWVEKTDPIYPSIYRLQMLSDLTVNHKLIGLSYSELVRYLGDPDTRQNGSLVYRIDIDYGNDIDPVYSKDLEFFYSKDSIITSFKILEWKK